MEQRNGKSLRGVFMDMYIKENGMGEMSEGERKKIIASKVVEDYEVYIRRHTRQLYKFLDKFLFEKSHECLKNIKKRIFISEDGERFINVLFEQTDFDGDYYIDYYTEILKAIKKCDVPQQYYFQVKDWVDALFCNANDEQKKKVSSEFHNKYSSELSDLVGRFRQIEKRSIDLYSKMDSVIPKQEVDFKEHIYFKLKEMIEEFEDKCNMLQDRLEEAVEQGNFTNYIAEARAVQRDKDMQYFKIEGYSPKAYEQVKQILQRFMQENETKLYVDSWDILLYMSRYMEKEMEKSETKNELQIGHE